jgi:aarF domain-containing kinase
VLKTPFSFPLEIVFRIYDHCLANGIEAIFGFSIALLKKNEGQLLGLKFDEILDFLNNRLLDRYMVNVQFLSRSADGLIKIRF